MLNVANTDKPSLYLAYDMYLVKAIIYHHEGKEMDKESAFYDVYKIFVDH